jgi:hypothetical protein
MGGTPIFRWFLVHDENNIKKKKTSKNHEMGG